MPTVFTKNRDRPLTTEMSRKAMAAILAHREAALLLSDEHFSVDGTLVKAWASMKSFQPKADATPPHDEGPHDPPASAPTADDACTQSEPEIAPMPRPTCENRNAEVDFKGEKRFNATHASTTDPDVRLYKKSPDTGEMLCFIGNALMENRAGLIVQGDLAHSDGQAERRAALDMIHRHSPGSTRQLTLGADKGFDAAEFVADLRQASFTPYVAQKARYSAIDGRTTRHDGYALSIKCRKWIEEAFGWAKTIGGMAQTVYRGIEWVRSGFILTMAGNNFARLPGLLAAGACKPASGQPQPTGSGPRPTAEQTQKRKPFRPADYISVLLGFGISH